MDFELITLIIRSLNALDCADDRILNYLLELSKVSRFDLCILMAADDLRDGKFTCCLHLVIF